MAVFRFFGRLLRFLGRFLDLSRRVLLNLLFLALLAIIVLLIWQPVEPVHDNSVLLIRPEGELVEQTEWGEPFELLMPSESASQTKLYDLLEAIDRARDDPRIAMLVVETDRLSQGGLSKLAELRGAIARFKESGKPVLARGERFTQGQYYLASAADEVHMAPDGLLLLRGLSRYATYYKNALDKLGIEVHVFRVGEYKSFSEPFTRTDMSEEDRVSTGDLLTGLWNGVRGDIAASRDIPLETVDRYVFNYSDLLAAAEGDPARVTTEIGLVDQLNTRDQWRALLQARVGVTKEEDLRTVGVSRYLASMHSEYPAPADKVAVLVAQGNIVDGRSTPGTVGGEDFSKLIRDVRDDDSVKAVVVRIDSPGGSAFASEQIRRELEVTRDAGKPVIISMSSTAASGGYWIAAGGSEIWAHPSTVTGSIGIFALVPNFAAPFNRLGLTVDGVSTGPLAGALDPRRPLDPEVEKAMQLGIEHGYRRFLETVGAARQMSPQEVDLVARGRVWLGSAAEQLGLVDGLGGIGEALAAAATAAGLSDYEIIWPEKSLSPRQLLMKQLSEVSVWLGLNEEATSGAPVVTQLLDGVRQEARMLGHWNDPRHLYAHCLCKLP